MSTEAEEEELFAAWQPQYAQLGLPIFPVEGKKPLVRGYLRVGLKASAKLAAKFPQAASFGLALGRRTGLTVLDVDTPDEDVLREAIARCGETPFVVRTGSGHFHAWYRHRGERRQIRPFADIPVDILGGGFVVVPPSAGSATRYTILRGSLDDLRRLPTVRKTEPISTEEGGGTKSLTKGQRNNALFRHALRHAPYVDDEDTLLDVVRHENDYACATALPDAEVVRLVHSAWRYQREGRNLVARRIVPVTTHEVDDLAATYPDALALLVMLRHHHSARHEFALGKAMAEKLGWTLPRFRNARARLVEAGYIRCIHKGGRGKHDPPIYCLGRELIKAQP